MLSSSISESVPQTLIRTGSDGRLRFSRQQREALVDAFEASGMSAMAFAKDHGVNYQTFVSWVRKRRESPQGELAAGQPAFAEVMLDHAAASVGLEVRLPGGLVLGIADRSSLPLAIELIRLLQRSC